MCYGGTGMCILLLSSRVLSSQYLNVFVDAEARAPHTTRGDHVREAVGDDGELSVGKLGWVVASMDSITSVSKLFALNYGEKASRRSRCGGRRCRRRGPSNCSPSCMLPTASCRTPRSVGLLIDAFCKIMDRALARVQGERSDVSNRSGSLMCGSNAGQQAPTSPSFAHSFLGWVVTGQ